MLTLACGRSIVFNLYNWNHIKLPAVFNVYTVLKSLTKVLNESNFPFDYPTFDIFTPVSLLSVFKIDDDNSTALRIIKYFKFTTFRNQIKSTAKLFGVTIVQSVGLD